MAEHSTTNIQGGHTSASPSAPGFMSASDKAKLDGVAAGADVTAANTPKAHAASHVSGSDAIPLAGATSGLMSAGDKAKLDSIASGADVTGASPPQAHAASHVGGSDAIANATAGAAGLMSAADKAKLDALLPPGFCMNWGTTVASSVTSGRYFIRTSGALSVTTGAAPFTCPITGTRTVYLTWSVAGTPLATDSVALTVFINGVATALTATMPPGSVSGQASGTLNLAAGDAISVRAIQSGTEAQAAWHASVAVSS